MPGKRFTVERIIDRLREAEVLLAQGQRIGEICRRLGIAAQTCDRRRHRYGGLKPDRVKCLKAPGLPGARSIPYEPALQPDRPG